MKRRKSVQAGLDSAADSNAALSSPLAAPAFTQLQGQYLAYIYSYTILNGRPPAERDLQMFFAVTPPSVHQMILSLASIGLLSRVPGAARSLQVLVEPEDLPILVPRS